MIVAVVAVLAAAGLAAGLLATRDGEEAGDDAVRIRYAFAPGETRPYTLDMTTTFAPVVEGADPFTTSVRARMDVAVAGMREDGSTVLDLSLGDVRVSGAPGSAPALEGEKVRLRVAPDGEVLDVEGGAGLLSLAGTDPGALATGQAAGAGSQLLFPRLPEDGLSPGETWSESGTVPLPFGSQTADVRTEGRFEGYERSARGRAAAIRLRVTTPADYTVTIEELREAAGTQDLPEAPGDGRITVDGTTVTEARLLMLPTTGELVELEGTTTMSMSMGFTGIDGAEDSGYDLEATIEMSIARA